MMDGRVGSQDKTRLEAQELHELELAHRQGEQWETVSGETLTRHSLKRMEQSR